jgi:hypothetical protein
MTPAPIVVALTPAAIFAATPVVETGFTRAKLFAAFEPFTPAVDVAEPIVIAPVFPPTLSASVNERAEPAHKSVTVTELLPPVAPLAVTVVFAV